MVFGFGTIQVGALFLAYSAQRCEAQPSKPPYTCVACPAGYFSPAGSTINTEHSSTKYNVVGCLKCEQGWFSQVAGSSQCSPCPPGTTTDYSSIATSLSSCKPLPTCLPGQQITESLDIPLGKNFYISFTWSPWGSLIRKPVGFTPSWTYVCTPCPLGSYKADTAESCLDGTTDSYEIKNNGCCDCPDGKTTQRTGSTSRVQCDVNDDHRDWLPSAPTRVPTRYPTERPTVVAPLLCPLGSERVATAATRISDGFEWTNFECMPCEAGTYGSYCGAVNDGDDCGTSSGKMCCYRESLYTNRCAKCPLGTQTAIVGATSVAQCTAPLCPAGMYLAISTPPAAEETSAADAGMSPGAVAGAVIGVVAFIAGLVALGYLLYKQKLALAKQDDLSASPPVNGPPSFPQHTQDNPSSYPEYPQYDDNPQQYSPPPGMSWQGRLSSDQSGVQDSGWGTLTSQRGSESLEQAAYFTHQPQPQPQPQLSYTEPSGLRHQQQQQQSQHQQHNQRHHHHQQQQQQQQQQYQFEAHANEISSRASPYPPHPHPHPHTHPVPTTRIASSRPSPTPASQQHPQLQPRTVRSGGISAGTAGRVSPGTRTSSDYSSANHGL